MQLLARLVGDPGREWHVLDLSPSGSMGSTEGGIGAGLDGTAKAAYRRRIGELRADLDEAEERNDGERVELIRAELAALTTEIARCVGLGGRDRPTGSASERARVRVTRALRSAIDRIQGELPLLGAHLDYAVRTGTYCSYTVDPVATPVNWELNGGGAAP
jgi:hypothetical protein